MIHTVPVPFERPGFLSVDRVFYAEIQKDVYSACRLEGKGLHATLVRVVRSCEHRVRHGKAASHVGKCDWPKRR